MLAATEPSHPNYEYDHDGFHFANGALTGIAYTIKRHRFTFTALPRPYAAPGFVFQLFMYSQARSIS